MVMRLNHPELKTTVFHAWKMTTAKGKVPAATTPRAPTVIFANKRMKMLYAELNVCVTARALKAIIKQYRLGNDDRAALFSIFVVAETEFSILKGVMLALKQLT